MNHVVVDLVDQGRQKAINIFVAAAAKVKSNNIGKLDAANTFSIVPVIVMAAVKNEAVTFTKMEVVDEVDGEKIKAVLAEHIASGQTVRSDGFPAYNVVKDINMVHDNQVICPKHGAPRYDVLKLVKILVSNAKDFILGTYHGVQKRHLQRDLDEYCYSFNRRFWPNSVLKNSTK